MMEIARFQDLLDRLGADVEAWPRGDRAAAHALLSQDPEARRRLEEARRLDAGLARLMARDVAGPSLRARLQAVSLPPQPRSLRERVFWPGLLSSPWPIGAGAALASLALGLVVGPLLLPPSASAESGDVMYLAYGLPMDVEDLP